MSNQNGAASVVNGSVEKTGIFTPDDTLGPLKQTAQAGTEAHLIKLPVSHEWEPPLSMAQAYFNELVELRRLNSQLHAHNKELEAFVYTVAHQLKNSFSLVILFGNALKESLKLPEATRPFLDGIIQSGHKMNNVINELQLLAGIREGKVELKPLNMGEIVASARQRLIHVIEERQVQFIAPDEWPTAWGYGPWIEEVWVNYIDNAIKYGGEPPRIELGATLQADKSVRFWIHDNGPGLSPEEQAQIFKPFIRLAQIKLEGHGLGLSIVQHIVKKLDGQVGIESQNVAGQGSIFMFTLSAYQS
jgi:two-component system sensor histidine kinase/response regulator